MEFAITMMMKDSAFEKKWNFPLVAVLKPEGNYAEAKTEVVRKAIHFLIALSPGLAAISRPVTVLLLAAGMLGYAVMERLRLAGIHVPLVSTLTSMASRSRDSTAFVLGPITLALGAILSLLLFPPAIACIGIYALAFGDGFAGLAGKLYGRIRPAFLFGKSLEGSIACFAATFTAAWLVSRSLAVSFAAAITATAVEALPLEDYDNIALPLAVCVVVQLF
jgi:dolichol kinase